MEPINRRIFNTSVAATLIGAYTGELGAVAETAVGPMVDDMTHEHRGVATHLVAYDLPDAQPAWQCSSITVRSVREHRPHDAPEPGDAHDDGARQAPGWPMVPSRTRRYEQRACLCTRW